MVDLSTARQNIVSEIIDGTPNTITPSKLRQLLTDTIDAIDALLLPFSVFDADAAPTADDDGANTSGNGVFVVGSKWYDQNAGEAYECLNNATGAAVWAPTTIDISDLGTAAAYNVGTSPNNIVQLNESGELPVVSGANLTNLPGADASTEFLDDVFRIQDNSDPTKEIDFDASGIATGTTRTITAPDRDVNLGDVKKINDAATAAPTTDDDSADGYSIGSIWNDITAKAAHILFDNSLGAAVWKSIAFLQDLASTDNGKGASLIGVEDANDYFDGDNQEAVNDELREAILWETIEEGEITSATAAIERTDLGDYRSIEIEINILPATDADELMIRSSTDNGVSFDAGASDYRHSYILYTGGTVGSSSAATSRFNVSSNLGNASGEGWSGVIRLSQFNQSAELSFGCVGARVNPSGGTGGMVSSGRRNDDTPRDAFQIKFLSGDIAAAKYIIRGVKS